MVASTVDVLAAAGARRAKVVCQSLGGWTGVRLALAWPELVEGLVLCCTLAGIAHPTGLRSFAEARQHMGTRGPAALALTDDFIATCPLMASLYRQLGAFTPPRPIGRWPNDPSRLTSSLLRPPLAQSQRRC
jgi:pimeloyl-ACP methyl ester carboxylesterase